MSIFQKMICFSLLLFAAVSCSRQNVTGENWSRWKGPNGDNTIQTEMFDPEFGLSYEEPVWRNYIGEGYSSASVSGGRIYVTGRKKIDEGNADIVYCLDAATGEELWQSYVLVDQTFPYTGTRSTPVVEDGIVYVLTTEGLAMALSARNGKVRWQTDLQKECGAFPAYYGFSSTAELTEDLVLFNACLAGVALDKRSGKVVWSTGSGLNGYASPVTVIFDGEEAACFFGNEALYVTSLSDGEVLASFEWDNAYDINGADPVLLDDSRILLSSSYGPGTACLDLSGGSIREIWRTSELATEFSNMIIHEGTLYAIDGDTANPFPSALKALDPDTGEVLWSERLNAYASLILINDYLVVLDENGQLFTVPASPNGFESVSRVRIFDSRRDSRTPPTYAEGKIYARSNTGELLCLDVN